MARKLRFKPAEVALALNRCKGLVYLAAKRLGCHANTVLNYIGRYQEVREAQEQSIGEVIDVAESSLFKATAAGEPWAIQFALKHLGKNRGYVERFEHTGKDGEALIDLASLSNEDFASYKAIRARALALPGNNGQGRITPGANGVCG